MDDLEKLIQVVGGVAKAASVLGITSRTAGEWRKGKIPKKKLSFVSHVLKRERDAKISQFKNIVSSMEMEVEV